MKIAIASQGKTLDSQTSSNAGKAPFYLIFNKGGLEEVLENPFTSGGGAGPGVAQMLADKKVEMVLLEQVGVNMENALKVNRVEIKLVKPGKIKDVIKQFL